jgi:hypothetical protein
LRFYIADQYAWEIMMGDKDKTKAQLMNEMMELRQRLIQLEKSNEQRKKFIGVIRFNPSLISCFLSH